MMAGMIFDNKIPYNTMLTIPEARSKVDSERSNNESIKSPNDSKIVRLSIMLNGPVDAIAFIMLAT